MTHRPPFQVTQVALAARIHCSTTGREHLLLNYQRQCDITNAELERRALSVRGRSPIAEVLEHATH